MRTPLTPMEIKTNEQILLAFVYFQPKNIDSSEMSERAITHKSLLLKWINPLWRC